MAGPAALLLGSLTSKGSGDSLPGESSGPKVSRHAEIMKRMWANMKAGEWDSAAMDFHDAYMECKGQEEGEDTLEDESGSDAEEDYSEEM